MHVTCQYLPIAIYCDLNKYGLRITTIQDIFKPVIKYQQAVDHPNWFYVGEISNVQLCGATLCVRTSDGLDVFGHGILDLCVEQPINHIGQQRPL